MVGRNVRKTFKIDDLLEGKSGFWLEAQNRTFVENQVDKRCKSHMKLEGLSGTHLRPILAVFEFQMGGEARELNAPGGMCGGPGA